MGVWTPAHQTSCNYWLNVIQAMWRCLYTGSSIHFSMMFDAVYYVCHSKFSTPTQKPALVLQGSSERSLDKKSATRCCLLCRYSLTLHDSIRRLHRHHEDDISRGIFLRFGDVVLCSSNLHFPTLSGVHCFQNDTHYFSNKNSPNNKTLGASLHVIVIQ